MTSLDIDDYQLKERWFYFKSFVLPPAVAGLLRNAQDPKDLPCIFSAGQLHLRITKYFKNLLRCLRPSTHPDVLIMIQNHARQLTLRLYQFSGASPADPAFLDDGHTLT
jgi:hypothetical protein